MPVVATAIPAASSMWWRARVRTTSGIALWPVVAAKRASACVIGSGASARAATFAAGALSTETLRAGLGLAFMARLLSFCLVPLAGG